MLERLVREIQAGGTLETKALAARLGASPRLIEAMLEHLMRSGLIQAYADSGDGCRGCNLRSSCVSGGRTETVRLWTSSGKQTICSERTTSANERSLQ